MPLMAEIAAIGRTLKGTAGLQRPWYWHPTQKFRELDGGRLEMTLRVADTLEVRRWILGFGSEAEVLEPAVLRDAVRRDAEALVRTLVPRRAPPTSILPSTGPAAGRAARPPS